MPTYEYRCKDCGHEFETQQAFSDDPLTECPTCKGALKKKFGSVGISFKGSGFYKNDSRGGSSSTTTATPSTGDSTSTSSSSSSDSTSSTSTPSAPSTSGSSSSGSSDAGSSSSSSTAAASA